MLMFFSPSVPTMVLYLPVICSNVQPDYIFRSLSQILFTVRWRGCNFLMYEYQAFCCHLATRRRNCHTKLFSYKCVKICLFVCFTMKSLCWHLNRFWSRYILDIPTYNDSLLLCMSHNFNGFLFIRCVASYPLLVLRDKCIDTCTVFFLFFFRGP